MKITQRTHCDWKGRHVADLDTRAVVMLPHESGGVTFSFDAGTLKRSYRIDVLLERDDLIKIFGQAMRASAPKGETS